MGRSRFKYPGACEVSGNSIRFSLLGGALEAEGKDPRVGELIGLRGNLFLGADCLMRASMCAFSSSWGSPRYEGMSMVVEYRCNCECSR